MNSNKKTIEEVFSSASAGIAVPSRDEFLTITGPVTGSVSTRNTEQPKRRRNIPSPFGWVLSHRGLSLAAGTLVSACVILVMVAIPGRTLVTTSPIVSATDTMVSELAVQADSEQSMATDGLDDEPDASEADILLQEI